jgi:hypothetical protein
MYRSRPAPEAMPSPTQRCDWPDDFGRRAVTSAYSADPDSGDSADSADEVRTSTSLTVIW